MTTKRHRFLNIAVVATLVLLPLPFAFYAAGRGLSVGGLHEQVTSRLFDSNAPLSNVAIYGHMLTGAVFMALAPLQLLSAVRRRFSVLHRASGYGVAVLAVCTGLAGLSYIALRGTIGGPAMDLGFALYGGLMVWAAVATVYFARKRDPRHRLWAERLVILALASWLYRVHYGVWEIATGGMGTRADFSGLFDQVQVFAFYLPYLLIHHWVRYKRIPADLV